MYRVKIPLVQFYSYCLSAAQQAGYCIVVCLIAREADSPRIYKDIEQNWSSLHDVTGKEVLFLFAGDSINDQIRGNVGSADGIFFYSEELAIDQGNHLQFSIPISSIDLDSATPYLREGSRLRSDHTLQISELRRLLGLSEQDVPSLHFTYLGTQKNQALPLRPIRQLSVYQFMKNLMEGWEPIFTEIRNLQGRIKSIKEELAEKPRGVEKFESAFSRVSWCAQSDSIDDKLQKVYQQVVTILSQDTISNDNRKLYYSLVNKIKAHPSTSKYEVQTLQRLFDLYYNLQRRGRGFPLKKKVVADLPKELENMRQQAQVQYLLLETTTAKRYEMLVSCKQKEGVPTMAKTDNRATSILFLAADPTDASRLRLGEELREIQEQLQLAKLRERFELQQRMSVRPADISQALLDIQPQIVHFSGHGTATGALCFENQIRETHPIQPDALSALFEQFASQVTCVLLNACYSEIQAKAVAQHIDYVIGMSQAISDKAAIAFAIGFYQALGAGRTIEEAYKLGCVQIKLQGIPDHLMPVLIKKRTI